MRTGCGGLLSAVGRSADRKKGWCCGVRVEQGVLGLVLGGRGRGRRADLGGRVAGL